jgi:hypothetical protein
MKILKLFLIASIMVSPAFAFAKDNHYEHYQSNDQQTNCFQAIGHFIAPGWIKHNGQLSLAENCHLPFGIGNKYDRDDDDGHPTTTPPITDTTPPLITNALAIIGTSTAQLSWTTDENATTKAYYSTTTPIDLNASSTMSVSDSALTNLHMLTVTGLATSTTYHMLFESVDASGNVARTNEFTFTTSP